MRWRLSVRTHAALPRTANASFMPHAHSKSTASALRRSRFCRSRNSFNVRLSSLPFDPRTSLVLSALQKFLLQNSSRLSRLEKIFLLIVFLFHSAFVTLG